MARRPTETSLPRAWPMLFPATFLAHIAEEYYGGFPAWAARWLGFTLTPAAFLELNAVAWTGMFAGSIAAMLGPRWLMTAFATATLVNGCAHLVATLLTRAYSPGVVTGALLWIPLGAFTLRRSHPQLSRGAFTGAVILGLALHAIVVLYARFG